MGEVNRVLREAPEIQRSHAVLQAQVERFHDQLSQAYETMGLGLTAEALVHEITYIADGLGERVAEGSPVSERSECRRRKDSELRAAR